MNYTNPNNTVNLVGRVTYMHDPRSTNKGSKVYNFGIAMQNNYKSSDGTVGSQFAQLTLFERTAKGRTSVMDYVAPGTEVAVIGHIASTSYVDKDSGKKITSQNIVVDSLALRSSKEDNARYLAKNSKAVPTHQNSTVSEAY